jgi:hypothetical protein
MFWSFLLFILTIFFKQILSSINKYLQQNFQVEYFDLASYKDLNFLTKYHQMSLKFAVCEYFDLHTFFLQKGEKLAKSATGPPDLVFIWFRLFPHESSIFVGEKLVTC